MEPGNFSSSYTILTNGVASPADDVGTYTVNPDCSGTFTDTTTGINANLSIMGGIRSLRYSDEPGLHGHLDAKKQ